MPSELLADLCQIVCCCWLCIIRLTVDLAESGFLPVPFTRRPAVHRLWSLEALLPHTSPGLLLAGCTWRTFGRHGSGFIPYSFTPFTRRPAPRRLYLADRASGKRHVRLGVITGYHPHSSLLSAHLPPCSQAVPGRPGQRAVARAPRRNRQEAGQCAQRSRHVLCQGPPCAGLEGRSVI